MSRLGRQTPTFAFTIPYTQTYGDEAVELYETTSRTAREWQTLLVYDILATDDEGLFVHSKYGYEVPRRNGKGEVIAMREMWGLGRGEKILHTAHRTTTSHSAWERMCVLLDEADIPYEATKQLGLETIKVDGGGSISFRTRSSKGGLGEGYDLLVIDEAQEYTIDQESALKYVVSDAENPQTLFCGTPPTAVSSGTVFMKMREAVMFGKSSNTGWAEWSVDHQSPTDDVELWYETNPSLGQGLTERKIRDEITNDDLDFNIQRLGYWVKYNQKSAITANEWEELKETPTPSGKLHVGIKYGHDNKNVSMAIAVRSNGKVFVEALDCQSIRNGNQWIIDFLLRQQKNIAQVVVDGANGQEALKALMLDFRLKQPHLPTVKEVTMANSIFEQAIFQKTIAHNGQPSLVQVATNCEKRAIGSNGGFGYRSQLEIADISLLDSVILAHWSCANYKEKQKQSIQY